MAIKNDKDKPRLGLIPTHAIFAAGRALTYGADGGKYGDYNYKTGEGLDWNRYYDAVLRHLFAWIGGEDKDKESTLSHLDHAIAGISMLIDAVESDVGKDTRFKVDKTPMELVQEDIFRQYQRNKERGKPDECDHDLEYMHGNKYNCRRCNEFVYRGHP
jgi:hypothetical protein